VGISVGNTIAGLDLLEKRVDEGLREAVAQVAHAFQIAGMQQAPVGIAGNSTNAPGDLKRSIDVEGPVAGAYTYVAMVGPTVVYARQREFGGDIYPHAATYLAFHWGKHPTGEDGTMPTLADGRVLARHVFQVENPYLKRAYDQTLPAVSGIVDEHIGAAVMGV